MAAASSSSAMMIAPPVRCRHHLADSFSLLRCKVKQETKMEDAIWTPSFGWAIRPDDGIFVGAGSYMFYFLPRLQKLY